jgi:hypothetical protein
MLILSNLHSIYWLFICLIYSKSNKNMDFYSILQIINILVYMQTTLLKKLTSIFLIYIYLCSLFVLTSLMPISPISI